MITTLIEAYPDWLTEGAIFSDLATYYSEVFEWLDNAQNLDIEFIGNYGGDKIVSPIIDRFIRSNAQLINPRKLTEPERKILADIIANKFKVKWQKLYALTELEYNPIENYSMTETERPNISVKHKVSSDFALKSKTSQNTDIEISDDGDINASGYGFNSSEAVPTADTHSENTQTQKGDADTNYTENEQTQEGYTEDETTGTRGLTRSGNIGVTTSQQMAESEIKLWQWNFFNEVFKDVASIITCPIYQ